ncbi:hypothetical protein cypCar_00001013 [Cyprinus carpio]|nr:hypothetical protein cypCar_00001013 [Cyprinus carpio]
MYLIIGHILKSNITEKWQMAIGQSHNCESLFGKKVKAARYGEMQVGRVCTCVVMIQSKKVKTSHGSTQGTQGQKADVKRWAAGKDACSPGPERSSESSHTMQKRAPKEARSTHSDSHSSQQHLMKTPSAEDEKGDVDLYRGEEEIQKELQDKQQSESEMSFFPSAAVGEAQSSVSAAEDLQTYSEREWKGNTTKSLLIRKGYEAIASEFNLRRVRGDNYCALRATLFQVLSQSKQLPAWLHDSDISKWPKEIQSDQDFIKEWQFPFETSKSKVQHLEQCLELLKKRWQETVQCRSLEERERMCRQVFRGHDEEYELLEALKFLMLRTAIHLHSDMEKGSDVPEFCWLLFARDSSKCPKTFLTNHLRHVGFSGGLEQEGRDGPDLFGFLLETTQNSTGCDRPRILPDPSS